MKFLTSIAFYFSYFLASAQDKADSTNGDRFMIDAGPGITIGEFSDTHLFNINADFTWSNKRFGVFSQLPKSKLGFAASLGFHYFFGSTEEISGQPYSYGNYNIITLSPGVIYNPCKKGFIGLFAGPSVNHYSNEFEAGMDISVKGGYFFKSRYGVNTSVHWVQLSKSDPIVFITLLLSMRFK